MNKVISEDIKDIKEVRDIKDDKLGLFNGKFKGFENMLSTGNMGRDILLVQGIFLLAVIVTSIVFYFIIVNASATSNPQASIQQTSEATRSALPYMWVLMNIAVILITRRAYKRAKQFKKELRSMYVSSLVGASNESKDGTVIREDGNIK